MQWQGVNLQNIETTRVVQKKKNQNTPNNSIKNGWNI